MADALVSSLTFDFGAADGAGEGTPSSTPPRPRRARARGMSAVSKLIRSWSARCLTGAAFPPRVPRDVVVPTFRRACGTMRRSDFCWTIAFRSFVLRATESSSEPSRSHRVRTMSFVTIPSPIRAFGSDGDRASPLQAGSPTERASPALRSRSTWSHTYDFFRARPRGEGRGTAQPLLRRRPAQRALVPSVTGSLRRGPGSGLAPPGHGSCRSHLLRARRCRALAARTATAQPSVGLSPCGAAVVAP